MSPRTVRCLFLTVLTLLLPNELAAARYVPAANPPTLVADIPTLATITVYVPFQGPFRPRIYLHRINPDGTLGANLGALRDDGTLGDQRAGDKLFSLVVLLNEPAAGDIPFRIAVYNGGRPLPRARTTPRTADFSILVLSVPPITTPAKYNEVVDDLFEAALELRTTVQLASGQPLEPTKVLHHQRQMLDGLLALYTNLEAIRRFESPIAPVTARGSTKSHVPLQSPTRVAFLLDFLNGLRKEGNDGKKLLTAEERFVEDGTNSDPDVVKIREQALQTACLEEHQLEGEQWRIDRQLCAQKFRNDTLPAPVSLRLGKIGIKAAGAGQATSLTGQGFGDLFNLNPIKVQALKGFLDKLFGKLIDSFTIPEASALGPQGLLLAEVEPGETIQVPAGESDFIYAFGGDTPRARVSGVAVPAGETVEVSFAPGETVDLAPTLPPEVDSFLGAWIWSASAPSCPDHCSVIGVEILIQGEQLEVRAILAPSFVFWLTSSFQADLPQVLPPLFTSTADAEDGKISVSLEAPTGLRSEPLQIRLEFSLDRVANQGTRLRAHGYLNAGLGESEPPFGNVDYLIPAQ